MLTLDEVADRLHYSGRDRLRSVRRAFQRYGVPLIRRDHRNFFATEAAVAALVEAMSSCPSQSENAEQDGTRAARSASVAKPATSRSTLRAAIEKKMPRRISRSSKPSCEPKSFSVVTGGRTD
jgi:hypothetical protein